MVDWETARVYDQNGGHGHSTYFALDILFVNELYEDCTKTHAYGHSRQDFFPLFPLILVLHGALPHDEGLRRFCLTWKGCKAVVIANER